MIERGEKQILLARHARRLLNYVDDTPIVPGDKTAAYEHTDSAKQVLEEAESDLRSWERTDEPIQTAAGQITDNLLPAASKTQEPGSQAAKPGQNLEGTDGTESVKTGDAVIANGVGTSRPQASGAIPTQEPIAV